MVHPFSYPEGYGFSYESAFLFTLFLGLLDSVFISKIFTVPLDEERSDFEGMAVFIFLVIRIMLMLVACTVSFVGVICGWLVSYALDYIFCFYLDDDEGSKEPVKSKEDN